MQQARDLLMDLEERAAPFRFPIRDWAGHFGWVLGVVINEYDRAAPSPPSAFRYPRVVRHVIVEARHQLSSLVVAARCYDRGLGLHFGLAEVREPAQSGQGGQEEVLAAAQHIECLDPVDAAPRRLLRDGECRPVFLQADVGSRSSPRLMKLPLIHSCKNSRVAIALALRKMK